LFNVSYNYSITTSFEGAKEGMFCFAGCI